MGDGVHRISYSSMSMHTHSTQLEISFTYPKVISDVDISSLVDKVHVSYCIMRTFLNCQVQGSVLLKDIYHEYTYSWLQTYYQNSSILNLVPTVAYYTWPQYLDCSSAVLYSVSFHR